MTAAPRGGTREQGRSEYAVALFLGVVGLVVISSAALLPDSRIARGPVGPEAVPFVVGGLLVVVSVVLAFDVYRGGRGEPEGGEDVDLAGGRDCRAGALPAAACGATALLLEPLGWPISGAILFWGSAFALGSRHYVRDAVIAIVLGVGSWYLFVLGLNTSLPVGILKGIL